MYEVSQPKFIEIVGDTEAFRLMLEGALGTWRGAYDVLLTDTNEYLYHARTGQRFCAFCRALRQNPAGDALCRKSDEHFARYIQESKQPYHIYTCHAGLTDVAVPIRVNDKLIATIYFGQVLLNDGDQRDALRRRAGELEQTLSLDAGKLTGQVEQVTVVDRSELDAIGKRVKMLADWVSRIGAERLQFRDKQRVEHHQLQASEIVRETSQLLNEAAIDWDKFWGRTAAQLEKMRDLVGAMCGVVLVPGRGKHRDRHIVVATSGLPADLFIGTDYELEQMSMTEMNGTRGTVVRVDHDNPASVHTSIKQWSASFARRFDKVFKVKLDLGDKPGVLAYFMNDHDDTANYGLKIDNGNRIEVTMLEHFAAAIAHAFNNRRLDDKRRDNLATQRVWLEKVSHQLTQAFGAVRGHASNIQEFVHELQQFYPESFQRWTPGDLKWFTDRIDDVMYSANNGARLAANLLRSAIGPKNQTNIEWEWAVIGDVAALMIEIARDFQGPAQKRKIGRVFVDTDSFKALNGRFRIITTDGLFKQAIGNLIDNAVKYAYPRTEIRVDASVEGQIAVINIHNEGIELLSSDTERIFEYGYRATAAQDVYAPGTGIGLYVAREIVEFHDGTLTANPSRRGRVINGVNHYLTTFTVMLPLLPAESKAP